MIIYTYFISFDAALSITYFFAYKVTSYFLMYSLLNHTLFLLKKTVRLMSEHTGYFISVYHKILIFLRYKFGEYDMLALLLWNMIRTLGDANGWLNGPNTKTIRNRTVSVNDVPTNKSNYKIMLERWTKTFDCFQLQTFGLPFLLMDSSKLIWFS